jgi:outer membrane protein assembly factor BamB
MRHWVPAVVLLMPLTVAVRADWPQWRHDAAHTGCAEGTLRPPLKLRWRFIDDSDPRPDPPTAVASYPRDHQVWHRYLGPYHSVEWICGRLQCPELLATAGLVFGDRGASGITCLDAETGEVQWRDPALAYTAAVERGLLVAVGPVRAAYLTVRDARTGEPRWSLEHWGNRRAMHFGVRDAATGDLRWAFTVRGQRPYFRGCHGVKGGLICLRFTEWHGDERHVPIDAAGVVHRLEVEEPHSASLYFLDAVDGSLVSENECFPEGTQRKSCGCSPYEEFGVRAWGEELLLLGGGIARGRGRQGAPALWAMLPNGRTLVGPLTPWCSRSSLAAMPAGGSAALAERARLALAIESSGLVCREALWGRLVWRVPLASATNGNFDPAVDESSVYLGLGDGKVYALDLRTGAVRWEQKVGNPLPEDWPWPGLRDHALEPICSVAGGVLWVVYRGRLMALDAETGELRWRNDDTEAAWYEPVISDGWLYLSTIHGIEAWGPDTGDSSAEVTPNTGETGQSPDG